MTEQHECEWVAMTIREPVSQRGQFFFKCSRHDCPSLLTASQASRRLNEYETLKRATDTLSAKLARRNGAILRINVDKLPYRDQTQGFADSQDMLAYADILEGKDG